MKEIDKRARGPNLRPVPPARSRSTRGVAVQMSASAESEVPVFSNFVTVNAGAGTAMIEFGFIDPVAITNASQAALAGKPLPAHLEGRLAVRVALGYDTLANLHKRLTQALANMGAGRTGTPGPTSQAIAPNDKPN